MAKGVDQGRVKVAAVPLLALFGNDPVSPERSRQMSRIRGRDTGPELRLRRALWAAGARFRLHVKDLPGRPDIANKSARVAIFVDGCFWHGCPRHFKAPATRCGFWVEKTERNKRRRVQVLRAFPSGWRLHQVFECQLTDARAAELANDLVRHRPS
ncbi:MAG TPA: very short patch repair endonuclease [Candidatus Thermoplasmatota archaeon]|nr:very short patch repair endonuclease [Candidatus Thermoplasmatota archaeon]